MQAPVNYIENDNPFGPHARFYFTPHLEKDILKLTARENGKKKFVYRSCNIAILGLVLKRVLKTETITNYLQRKIWTPLQMENPGLWTVDHEGDGLERTWCCIAGTGRDFARIALLYQHQGKWGNTQVISPEWIQKTLAPLFAGNLQIHYNYNWWLVPEKNAYMAIGKDGQYAYNDAARKVTIIRLGNREGNLKRSEWVNLFVGIAQCF